MSKSKVKSTMNLENCIDDRDPISMTIFWTEDKGKRTILYPKENIKELIFYKDTKGHVRCFEKESLVYMKTYNINTHPVTMEILPINLFNNIKEIDMDKIIENKTIEDIAFAVFQNFSKISIFIDNHWFLDLDRKKLLKFNYEVKDFWLQNFTSEQKTMVSSNVIFAKSESDMTNMSVEEIQLYLLNQMKILLNCDKEELKYMISYILVGALGIVIPKIKDLYPDFDMAF